MMSSNTFIDYDDIETPIKAVLRGAISTQILPRSRVDFSHILKTHEFFDVTKPLQLFTEPDVTPYFNIAETYSSVSEMKENDTNFF